VTSFVQLLNAEDSMRSSDLKLGSRYILNFPEVLQSHYALQSDIEEVRGSSPLFSTKIKIAERI